MGATLILNGSSSSISDITPAAGWRILNCTANTNTQTVKLICVDDSKGCGHLFQGGAEHTVVRLPNECGTGPFARVAKHWTPANEDVPADHAMPQVHFLQIDTNFRESTSSGTTVAFSLVASTNPVSSSPPSISKRDGNPTSFDESTSGTENISFDKSVELFNTTLTCSANEESTLSIGVEVDVDLTVELTFEIKGTVIPPDVSEFTATTTINGTFDGTLNVDADLTGTLDTGEVVLVTVGLPGLSIPDILTVGPQFVLNAEASATLNLEVEVSIGIHYELDGLTFTVGSSSSSSPGFNPLDSPVQFSLDPSVSAEATLEAHLIPTLGFGISAFDNSATVFVDLDAGLEIDLNATVEGAVTISTGGGSASESAEACIDVSSPISFNVGASGNFFDIISGSTSIEIFEETFEIYQSAATSTTLAPSSSPPSFQDLHIFIRTSIILFSLTTNTNHNNHVDCPRSTADPLHH
ncbi:hypothetical protein SCHPADRAFT_937851 [Schizopora paradoxa]|uniref:DUF7223 domain-containing protein n=1 Tax=Schizopora paradoxa TaxID=27342 RepID=A0A0H2RY18_9AGAM|nr:hypothetical protein SCHPADRAFT_937851 [Schizopora paradoxa]